MTSLKILTITIKGKAPAPEGWYASRLTPLDGGVFRLEVLLAQPIQVIEAEEAEEEI